MQNPMPFDIAVNGEDPSSSPLSEYTHQSSLRSTGQQQKSPNDFKGSCTFPAGVHDEVDGSTFQGAISSAPSNKPEIRSFCSTPSPKRPFSDADFKVCSKSVECNVPAPKPLHSKIHRVKTPVRDSRAGFGVAVC
jgi:hypothetical protein